MTQKHKEQQKKKKKEENSDDENENEEDEDEPSDKKEATCTHSFLSGKNVGKRCTQKLSAKSTKYCTLHLKYEKEDRKESKTKELKKKSKYQGPKTLGRTCQVKNS